MKTLTYNQLMDLIFEDRMMNTTTIKKLTPFINQLRELKVQATDNITNIKNVSLILKKWIQNPEWLDEQYQHVDIQAGFSSWLIHEEIDHTLAVNLVAWQPGREIVPHDHKTWGVVGSVLGIEKNFFWTRLDDGSIPGHAEIKKEEAAIIRPAGELVCFMPDDIHSVVNESKDIAVSLHVYGKNLNFTNRFQYAPEHKTCSPFIISFT